jgi:large subunit ribosomal protein L32
MALQKRRLGRTRIHHRRSAWMRLAANHPTVQKCPNCDEPKQPHRICLSCGQYKGEQIVAASGDADE